MIYGWEGTNLVPKTSFPTSGGTDAAWFETEGVVEPGAAALAGVDRADKEITREKAPLQQAGVGTFGDGKADDLRGDERVDALAALPRPAGAAKGQLLNPGGGLSRGSLARSLRRPFACFVFWPAMLRRM